MIEFEQARELLKRAMETQGPDFVYCNLGGGCFYEPVTEVARFAFGNGPKDALLPNDNRRKTGCLIGVVLDLAGETRHHNFTENVLKLTLKYPDMMTSSAAYYLWEAQRVQDRGGSWGQAYEAAEQYAEAFLMATIYPKS